MHQFHAKPPSSAKVAQPQVTNLGAGVEQGRAVQWVSGSGGAGERFLTISSLVESHEDGRRQVSGRTAWTGQKPEHSVSM